MKSGKMPLTSCTDKGTVYRVCGICCGDQGGRRLWDMGLYPGVELHVIRNDGGGPIYISVEGSRYGLGRGMAEKVMVTSLIKSA